MATAGFLNCAGGRLRGLTGLNHDLGDFLILTLVSGLTELKTGLDGEDTETLLNPQSFGSSQALPEQRTISYQCNQKYFGVLVSLSGPLIIYWVFMSFLMTKHVLL